MFYTKIEKLPRKKKGGWRKKNVRIFLDEFMAEDIKMAKVHFRESEYISPYICRSSLSQTIKRGSYPITVTCIDKNVYLVRKDI